MKKRCMHMYLSITVIFELYMYILSYMYVYTTEKTDSCKEKEAKVHTPNKPVFT